jgi:hypothetical protein
MSPGASASSVIAGVLLALSAAGSVAAPAAAQSATSAPSPISGTATAPTASSADIDSLRERVAAFWAARVAGNYTAQWELHEPRARGRMTPGEYTVQRGVLKYLAYQVEDASVNGYFSIVRVRVLVQPLLPTASPRALAPAALLVQDRWVKIGGTWYRSLEQEESGGSAETSR